MSTTKPYDNLDGEILMTIFNNFDSNYIFNYQRFKPDIYDLLHKIFTYFLCIIDQYIIYILLASNISTFNITTYT